MQFITRWFPGYPNKFQLVASVGLLLLLAVIACGPAATDGTSPTPTTGSPPSVTTAGPTPTPGMMEHPAPIESAGIEVSTTESPKADLVVVSGLPNGCYSFGHYNISREGNSFRVDIVNLIPDDPMLACTMVYGMVTTRIPLEGGVEICKFYDVVINGESYSLQAIAPNARCGNVSEEPNGADSEVQLAFGESNRLDWADLELTLMDVTEDSRCPSDVTCVWAGRATALIKVDRNGEELGQFPLTFGEGPEASSVGVDNYTIEIIGLDPHPVSTVGISREDYVARVVVTTPNAGEVPEPTSEY